MTTATSASDRYAEARAALVVWESDECIPGYAESMLAVALRALIDPPATEETVDTLAALREYIGDSNTDDGFDQADMLAFGGTMYRAGIRAAWESWEPEVAKGTTGPALLKMFAYDFAEWWESDEANDAQDIVSAQENFADEWWAEFTA